MDENNNVGDRQWLKFGILAGILLIVVLVIALLRPIIFGRIVPAVMGGDGEKTAVDETIIVDDAIIEEAPTETNTDAPVDESTATDSTEETETSVEDTTTVEEAAPVDDTGESDVDGADEEETAVNTITYTVKAGDSIYSIARAYNLNPETIVILNNIPNPNNILIGTELLIPQP